jgi:toxin ParE1/3/4
MSDWEFHPEARAELDAAVEWYEQERAGLGAELLDGVEEALRNVAEHPTPGTRVAAHLPEHLRRLLLLERFHYALIVDVRASRRLVLAVAHLRRRPHYWRKRLTK